MQLTREQQPALSLFAVGMIGMGILGLIVGDFAMVWQPGAPWRTALAYRRSLHFAMPQRAIGSGRDGDHMRR